MKREEMIEALTRNDLNWLASGNATTKDLINDCVRFFAAGGYSVWSDETLLEFYTELQEDAA